ncbi:MAG: hypothetical protein WAT20_07255, partial [Ferruginibacter sp.]
MGITDDSSQLFQRLIKWCYPDKKSIIYPYLTIGKPIIVEKTEVLQTSSATFRSKRKFHFQIDGEYRGKRNNTKYVNLIINF